MRSTHWIHITLITLALLGKTAAIAQNPVYDYVAKQQRADVAILAISSSIHPAWGTGQEVYLANIRLKGNPIQLVKLVDTYPPDRLPILRSILIEQHLLQMTLIRNPQCDSTGLNFFLGSSETNIFNANTRTTLNDHPTEMILCFNVVHDATRLRN
jgi:hypothetical protein